MRLEGRSSNKVFKCRSPELTVISLFYDAETLVRMEKEMTRKRKKRKTSGSRKMKSGIAGTSIYMRCRFCRRGFYGNSKDVFKGWQEHEDSCEKKSKQDEKM